MTHPETTSVLGRDGVELQLTDIWRRLLGRDDVGIHDDFFSLGGHSLLAIKLTVEVRRLFQVDLTAADLLSAATVAELAEIVRGGTAERQGQLVRVQQGSGDSPVYALPPVSGTVLLYPPIARAMGLDQPFWALQSLGLLPGEEPLSSLEEIAEHFIEQLRTVHPDGAPWNLIGYSMGGLLAYEIARRLQERGERVGLVGLLDTRITVEPSGDPDFALRALLWRGLRLELDVDWLRGLDPGTRAQVLVERAVAAGTMPADFDADRLRRMIDMYQHNLGALTAYKIKPYDGPVTVFRVTDRSLEDGTLPDDLGWSEVAEQAVVIDVPGDHFTMVEPGQVEVLGRRLREQLDTVSAAAPAS
ncbi:Thioesterase domain-containing protein [Streptomyces sp. 2224.1]|uniref:thioesterase domain-containing protein n=1 Tax=unclassified Streptomyces TaxID=2593676 RepID=UPI00088D7614|nr:MULTISPECIES: thioesterase domain-containing protein [unclassified Streptomyces]PBC84057.1 thioesterase domain-containing protein [Streptomyces sp. 2321.6]SDR35532.1 Thioesterase domain-containing protein [Streptomyces sp. KS_16]SEB84439.1 Thioesterase domain-containing protein [Streptomyces sp. 2224.1]SED18396.1 Thioesterase domain-containing protein [Streptomyces sp. 2133.1]SEE62860.1 Thioesterase domain-containing protein [Streptomyces sp. 2112.3]